MSIPPPRAGAVIRYAYLWRHERDTGREEAVKERPAAVALAHREEVGGTTMVFVLPITHSPPADDTLAVEIPAEVKSALGLDGERSWIVCDEVNRFVWPGFDVRPVPGTLPARWEYGMLPRGLFEQARRLLFETRQRRRLRPVDRT